MKKCSVCQETFELSEFYKDSSKTSEYGTHLSNDDHVSECFNWTNLQPLWKSDNMSKGGKVDDTYIENHKLIALEYKSAAILSAQVKESELLEHP